MSMSGIFARIVALIGAAALAWRRRQGAAPEPAWGSAPVVPVAKPQGVLPTLKMPSARGWSDGQKPVAAPGLEVNAFATGLKHPRWIEVLPNGDVLVAESNQVAGPVRNVFGYAMQATMRRARALGVSANRITAKGRKLVSFKPSGHWTRSLLRNPDGTKLYVGVGSLTNIADNGMEVEQGRAAVYELDLASGNSRIFAGGLRNPVGLAWEPGSGVLWTVVNERDGLGDETPPDYLTSVREGGFYGWPYCYWGQMVDDRVPQDPAAVAKAITPDYALGGHTASLGLCWLPAGTLPGFPDGMAIGQHGSWNRSTLSGYKVVFVPFVNGRPSGPPRDILSGFLAPDERESYGRPVGVALGPDGSVLVADDVGDVIWRVTGKA